VNVALRNGNGYPSRSGIAPIIRNTGRNLGRMGGTCQVPQPGVAQVYPACPPATPLVSGGPTAYVAPNYTPAPACSSSDPNTADSAACIALLLSTQQANMQLANNANYNSDVGTCESNLALNNQQRASEGLAPLPDTCSSNSYGLVPTGGYTGSGTDEENAAGQPSNVSAAAQVVAAETGAYVPPVQTLPSWGIPTSTPIATPPQQGGTSAASTNGSSDSTGNGSGSGAVVPISSNTMLYVVGGIAAVLLVVALMK
jgi:hypothetical protein